MDHITGLEKRYIHLAAILENIQNKELYVLPDPHICANLSEYLMLTNNAPNYWPISLFFIDALRTYGRTIARVSDIQLIRYGRCWKCIDLSGNSEATLAECTEYTPELIRINDDWNPKNKTSSNRLYF